MIQSILAGAQYMKFAFVTRKSMDDAKSHVIVGTHAVKTLAWAKQLNLNMDKMWCIVKRICEEVENGTGPTAGAEGAEDSVGEYILLKDFNKLELRLYKKDIEDDEDEEEEADAK